MAVAGFGGMGEGTGFLSQAGLLAHVGTLLSDGVKPGAPGLGAAGFGCPVNAEGWGKMPSAPGAKAAGVGCGGVAGPLALLPSFENLLAMPESDARGLVAAENILLAPRFARSANSSILSQILTVYRIAVRFSRLSAGRSVGAGRFRPAFVGPVDLIDMAILSRVVRYGAQHAVALARNPTALRSGRAAGEADELRAKWTCGVRATAPRRSRRAANPRWNFGLDARRFASLHAPSRRRSAGPAGGATCAR
jgi:hypothetical protein